MLDIQRGRENTINKVKNALSAAGFHLLPFSEDQKVCEGPTPPPLTVFKVVKIFFLESMRLSVKTGNDRSSTPVPS